MVENTTLFEYEFKEKEKLNFIIGLKDKNLLGLIGYIKSNSGEKPTIWPSLWKVVPNLKDPLLGIKLFKFLREKIEKEGFLALGANKQTLELYKFLKIQTGVMKHYYLLNPNRKDFKIAHIDSFLSLESLENVEEYQFRKIDGNNLESLENFFDKKQCIPNKDLWYIKKRYLDYPIHLYELYFFKSKDYQGLLVGRTVEYNESRIFRIVDLLGDQEILLYLKELKAKLFRELDYEYIDFLCYGFSNEIMKNAGFRERIEKDRNIIPNYFSPFVLENTDIYFFVDNLKQFRLTKADGDQDRPNVT